MTKMRKILTMVMAVAVICTAGCGKVTTEQTSTAEIKTTEAKVLTKEMADAMETVDGVVTIPDDITAIGEGAFERREDITQVIIPESVSKIADSSFRDCINLEKAVIPEGVKKIGQNSFNKCEKLHDIKIPNSVTEISGGAFGNCESLTSEINLKNVEYLGDSAFAGSGITGITFPDNIKEIPWAVIAYCDNITEVVIPDGVTKIKECAFYSCNNITNIVMPDSIEIIENDSLPNSENLTLTYNDKTYSHKDSILFYSTFYEAPFIELPNGMTTDDLCGMLYYNGEQLHLPLTVDKFSALNENWRYDDVVDYSALVYEIDDTGERSGNGEIIFTHQHGDIHSQEDVDKYGI